MSDRDHIPAVPKFVLYLRFAQVGLAVLVLALSAYALSKWALSGADLLIYASISTMIATVYMIVAEMRFPVIYNYWAIIGLDAYEVVIWLAAMALQASEISNINQLLNYFTQGPLAGSSSSSGTPSTVNPFGDPTTSSPDSSSTSTSSSSASSSSGSCGSQETLIAGVCIPNNYLGSSKLVRSLPTPGDIFNNFKSVNDGKTFRDICAVNSALAGIALVLFVITLIFIALALHRHRQHGGHCMPGTSSRNGPRNISRERKDKYDAEQQYESVRPLHQHPQPQQFQPEPQYVPQPQQQYTQPQHQHYAGEPQYAPVQPPQPY